VVLGKQSVEIKLYTQLLVHIKLFYRIDSG